MRIGCVYTSHHAHDYRLTTADGKANLPLTVEANDHTEQRETAKRLAACWNCLHGLSLSQVQRLGSMLARYNADEVEDFLRAEDL